MKLSPLAKRINMQPNALFRELLKRGQKIPSVEHPLDRHAVEALLKAAEKPGRIDFDALFGPVKEEFKEAEGNGSAHPVYNLRDNQDSAAKTFELDVGKCIRERFPNSHLSGVFLFLADQLGGDNSYGRELDHLLHVREGDFHRLIIVECKNQRISPDPNVVSLLIGIYGHLPNWLKLSRATMDTYPEFS